MELGISTWSMGENQMEGLKRIVGNGFKLVEIWPEPHSTFRDNMDELLDALSVYDVKGCSMHAPFAGLDISDRDEKPRKDSLKRILGSVGVAGRLGCAHLVVHPSEKKYDRREDCEKAKGLLVRSVKELVKRAEENGVTIALENMLAPRNGFRVGTRVAELREIIRSLHVGNVGVCLDTGHAHYNGLEACEETREAGDLLMALHVNDNDGMGDQHRVPGEGTINWPPFMETLKEINYSGIFMLEIFGGDEKEERLRNSYKAASKLLNI